MVELNENELFQEEELESQEESTMPWTIALVLALVLQIVAIFLCWTELSSIYKT
jgi:hypothetical protein